MSEVLDRLDTVARTAVAWLERRWWGGIVRLGIYAFTVAWPLILDSGFVSDDKGGVKVIGFIAYLVLAGLSATLLKYKGAAEQADASNELVRIEAGLAGANAILAGALEGLAVKLDASTGSGRRTLPHDACRETCIGLLARIQSLAQTALGSDASDLRLRVTLALPLRANERHDKGEIVALRVWCYDRTYPDRRFTRMALDGDGAPEAFRDGAVAIIPDIHTLDIPDATARQFRSVVCYPIRSGAGLYEPLGVVNIDAEHVGFFTPERNGRLNTYIQPAVQAIGIPLASRRHGPLSFSP